MLNFLTAIMEVSSRIFLGYFQFLWSRVFVLIEFRLVSKSANNEKLYMISLIVVSKLLSEFFWSCLISSIICVIFFVICVKNLTINSKSRNIQLWFWSISRTQSNKRPFILEFSLFSPQNVDCAISMQCSPPFNPNWETQ